MGKTTRKAKVQKARLDAKRGGRPRKPDRKQQITLRLDPDVLAYYRAMGSGWQTAMNNDLLRIATLEKPKRHTRDRASEDYTVLIGASAARSPHRGGVK